MWKCSIKQIITTIAIAVVAVIHIAISVVEIFFWETPLVYQRLDFSAELASKVTPIVKNAGLYNSFIAAGLIWGALSNEKPVRVFFLVYVVIAGIFGALILKWTNLILQSLPASAALLLAWLTHS